MTVSRSFWQGGGIEAIGGGMVFASADGIEDFLLAGEHMGIETGEGFVASRGRNFHEGEAGVGVEKRAPVAGGAGGVAATGEVEFIGGAHQPDGGVGDEFHQRAIGTLVLAGDVDGDAEIALDDLVFEFVGLVEQGFQRGDQAGRRWPPRERGRLLQAGGRGRGE